jgi:outer membrane protein assembly factor BamB
MRSGMLIVLTLPLCGGCGYSAPESAVPSQPEPAGNTEGEATPAPVDTSKNDFVAVAPGGNPPPSLWMRKKGIDWPIFLGPTQDSKSPEKGIATKWGGGVPRIVWHKKLGTSYGAPTIAGGRLFQFDRFGSKSRLYCLNAETGAELWRYEMATEYEDLYQYNNGPRCSPVVDGDRVYAYGVDGVLACVRTADGQPVWKKNLHREFGVVQNFFGVGSTPVIEGDFLIVMVGGSPPDSHLLAPGQLDRVEPNGSGIVAFDKYTGDVKYKLANELASYASLKLATIGQRRWCFAFCRGGLVGFEPGSGKLDFHYPWRAPILERVNASMPVVAGNEVVISETYGPGGSLLRVSPGKYEVIWNDDRRRDKAMQTHWNTPVYLDGYLYGCSGRHPYNAELRCIEWQTGKVMWSIPELTRTSLLYIDGYFVCLGEYGQLTLFKANPQEYEPVATADLAVTLNQIGLPIEDSTPGSRKLLKYPCWAAPIVSHGLLYLRGDERLVCLELIPES